MNYVLLALLAIVLLTGLIAFGVGHRRWSWGTLVAAFLVLLAATGYLYLASRFAAYESAWVQSIRRKQVELARVKDALVPDPAAGGRLKPMAGPGADAPLESRPLRDLTAERDRWQRALDRINTWRGRSWSNASFEPPAKDDATGRIEIPFGTPPAAADADAAAGAAPAAPPAAEPGKPSASPVDPGAIVYVFDDAAAAEGGRYLGAFLVETAEVETAEPDPASSRFVLTVRQTAQRDEYDARSWEGDHAAVTVYDSLPSDRWVAFSATSPETASEPVMPEPTPLGIEKVEELLDERDRQRGFLEDLGRHDTVTDKEEWQRIRERLDAGTEPPGSHWAVVTFKEEASVPETGAAAGAEAPPDAVPPQTFAVGDTAEFDLQTAFALADKGTVTIDEVRYRRRLSDARTALHGSGAAESAAGGQVVLADGIAALVAVLHREIDRIKASISLLDGSRNDITAEIANVRERATRLANDKLKWERDAEAAERTAAAFDAAVTKSRQHLAATEREIVSLATSLRGSIGRLVEQIDAVAPAPERAAAATP